MRAGQIITMLYDNNLRNSIPRGAGRWNATFITRELGRFCTSSPDPRGGKGGGGGEERGRISIRAKGKWKIKKITKRRGLKEKGKGYRKGEIKGVVTVRKRKKRK